MDELTRFEYQKKAAFADIAMDILTGNHAYEFKKVANDEHVRETSQIFAYDEYESVRRTLVPYIVKYGYENVNAFVREMIARMPQKDDE